MRKIIYGIIAIILTSDVAVASEAELSEILKRYQTNLPCLEQINSKAESIVNYLSKFRSPQYRKALPEEDKLRTHIEHLMATGLPLRMTLPSFPCKSKNTEHKVIGEDPDLGEVVALLTLGHICQQITDIYKPGAQIILQADGFYAVEALKLPDLESQMFVDKIKLLIKTLGLESHISILSPDELPDARVHSKSFDELRQLLDRDMAAQISKESQDSRSLFCANELDCDYYRTRLKAETVTKVKQSKCYRVDLADKHVALDPLSYDDLMKLNHEDAEASLLKFIRSCAQQYNGAHKPFAKQVTECIVRRAAQFKMLLDQIYLPTEVVRLKIHMDDKPVMSQRLPISLIYNDDDMPGTPWHHTPVVSFVGNTQVRILMVHRNRDFQHIKEAKLKDLPFLIRWAE